MPQRVQPSLLDRGVLAGLPLARWFPDDAALRDALLVCTTEVTGDDEIEHFASALRSRSSGAADGGPSGGMTETPASARRMRESGAKPPS